MNFVRPWLAIGSLRDSCDRRLLSENGIGAILQLAESVEHPDIVSLYLPVDDGEPLSDDRIAQGVQFAREQRAAGKNVLIACGLGVSRSVTFAIAALKECENVSLSDAFTQILHCRPQARPNIVLWQSLCRHYGEDAPYLDVFHLREKQVRGGF
jgi:hypothetical protein